MRSCLPGDLDPDLVCATNPAGAASLTLGKQQRGALEHGPGGTPVLPATEPTKNVGSDAPGGRP